MWLIAWHTSDYFQSLVLIFTNTNKHFFSEMIKTYLQYKLIAYKDDNHNVKTSCGCKYLLFVCLLFIEV